MLAGVAQQQILDVSLHFAAAGSGAKLKPFLARVI
jgi:hypothetical protein